MLNVDYDRGVIELTLVGGPTALVQFAGVRWLERGVPIAV